MVVSFLFFEFSPRYERVQVAGTFCNKAGARHIDHLSMIHGWGQYGANTKSFCAGVSGLRVFEVVKIKGVTFL